jgi:hypothetical protein
LKTGDLVRYIGDAYEFSFTEPVIHGLIISINSIWAGNEIEPPMIEVLLYTGHLESVSSDEFEVVNV